MDLAEITKEAYQAEPNRYFLLDGRTLSLNSIPKAIQEDVLPQCTETHYSCQPPTDNAICNDFCTIISSKPAENTKFNTLGVPQFAFKPIGDEAPIASEQFLSEDTGRSSVYIGLLLGQDVPEMRLESITLIVRTPMESINFSKIDLKHPVNPVPLPKVLQIFATNDTYYKGQNPDDLNWIDISNRIIAATDMWGFMMPTTLDCVGDESKRSSIQAFKGFKLVVNEWDYTHAEENDRLPGFSRISFNFFAEDIRAAKNVTRYQLPMLSGQTKGTVMGYDFGSTKQEVKETIPQQNRQQNNQQNDLEDDQQDSVEVSFSSELIQETINQIKDTCIKEIQDVLVQSTVDLAIQNCKKIVDEATLNIQDLFTKKANIIRTKFTNDLQELGQSTERKLNALTTNNNLSVLLKRTEPYVHLQEQFAYIEKLHKECEDIRAAIASELEMLKTLSNFIVIEDITNSDNNYSRNLKKIDNLSKFIVVNEQSSIVESGTRQALELVLDTSTFEQYDTVEIINMRSDSGEIRIKLDNGLLTVVAVGQTYPDLKDVSLTIRGEAILLYNINNTWTGRVSG